MKPHRSTVVLVVLLLVTPLARAQRSVGTNGVQERQAQPKELNRITLRPMTIANAVDELAGKQVRVVNARVVGVFEPRAFLIEDATRHELPLRMRDRLLVLVDGGSLTLPAEELVASNVVVIGAARTLLGLRASREVPWPPKLDRELIERLEIRAGVLATAVQTPEGDPLTGAQGSGAGDRRSRFGIRGSGLEVLLQK